QDYLAGEGRDPAEDRNAKLDGTRQAAPCFASRGSADAARSAHLALQRSQESENTRKIRTLLGLTVIGTALYAHKRNGGEFTVESMKKSLNDLWSGIQGKAGEVKARAAQLADEIPDKMKGVADSVRSGATSAATS